MPKSSDTPTMRRRGRSESDLRGNTTEEDTDLADDPRSSSAPIRYD